MHIPIPVARTVDGLARLYRYFRSGVDIEGRAWFCTYDHSPSIDGQRDLGSAYQHIDVELFFWNRRRDKVTLFGLADARIVSRTFSLTASDAAPFESVTLAEGEDRQRRFFVLVPERDPRARVEASTGELLELQFRPSRGSERRARPRVALSIGVRTPSDPLG